MIESEPLTDHSLLRSMLTKARKLGVTSISMNIECFDENLREDIMPAKGKIPIQEYLENWDICVDIFGKNEVSTVIVVGIGEDDQSIILGVETAASRGVLTFLVPHSPAPGAVYEDMVPPSADRMLRLYEKAAGIYRQYGLDLCKCTAGCVKGGGFQRHQNVAMFGVYYK
jgi:biotin synthase-related radical SAM superfamily protein